MPYVVTTKRPTVGYDVTAGQEPITERGEVVSRRAVDTLEEAQTLASDAIYDSGLQTVKDAEPAFALPESGGTVGPLPDGTLITVERVED